MMKVGIISAHCDPLILLTCMLGFVVPWNVITFIISGFITFVEKLLHLGSLLHLWSNYQFYHTYGWYYIHGFPLHLWVMKGLPLVFWDFSIYTPLSKGFPETDCQTV